MTVAKFPEDAYDEDGGETLTVALDVTGTRVCVAAEAADVWPPLYFTPQRAREIGQALLDAARAADGRVDPASLFAAPRPAEPPGRLQDVTAAWRRRAEEIDTALRLYGRDHGGGPADEKARDTLRRCADDVERALAPEVRS